MEKLVGNLQKQSWNNPWKFVESILFKWSIDDVQPKLKTMILLGGVNAVGKKEGWSLLFSIDQ